MAIAATTITAERAKKVDFTDPYYNASQGLLVPTGSDIKTVDDLAGKIVGAQDGTTGETYANDNTDAAEVRPFPQTDDAYNALKTGQVDAVLNDLTAVQAAAKQLGGLEVVQDFPTEEQYGMYAQKGSPIIAALNDGAAAGQGRRHADRPVPAVVQDRPARCAAAARARRRARRWRHDDRRLSASSRRFEQEGARPGALFSLRAPGNRVVTRIADANRR